MTRQKKPIERLIGMAKYRCIEKVTRCLLDLWEWRNRSVPKIGRLHTKHYTKFLALKQRRLTKGAGETPASNKAKFGSRRRVGLCGISLFCFSHFPMLTISRGLPFSEWLPNRVADLLLLGWSLFGLGQNLGDLAPTRRCYPHNPYSRLSFGANDSRRKYR